MPTGEIEVLVDDIKVLSAARQNLPYLIRDYNKVREGIHNKSEVLYTLYLTFSDTEKVLIFLLAKSTISNHMIVSYDFEGVHLS